MNVVETINPHDIALAEVAWARARCAVPATLLKWCLGLGLLIRLLQMLVLTFLATPIGQRAGGYNTMRREFPFFFIGGAEAACGGVVLSIPIGIFGLYGVTKMAQLRSWGLALAAVIMSSIPCIGPCCIFPANTLIGLWAIVVLCLPGVRRAFASVDNATVR